MGISSILNTAKTALLAQQTAIQVTSNNIANVNTEGYARQEAVLAEQTPTPTDIGLLGNGVQVTSVISHFNKYLNTALAKEITSSEEQKTYEQYFSRIESVLDENNTNLTSNITVFFNAWQDLSTDPTSTTSRLNVQTSGANLANGIRDMYSQLQNMQSEVDDNISQKVDDINDILNSLSELNGQITSLKVNGQESSSFVSQRAQLVQKLSAIVGIQSFEDAEGALTIMVSGKTVLSKETVFELKAEKSSSDDNFYRITWDGNTSSSVDVTDLISGGSLKALLDLRDNQLPNFMGTVDDLAQSLITQVNDIHSTGYAANGATGINFFQGSTDAYALTFNLSDEVKADSQYIAGTSSAANPTDNDIALAISDLGSASLTIGSSNSTYAGYGAAIASRIGSLAQNATDLSEYHQNLLTSIKSQVDSISGVSIDEEMSNLIKFQYAYQAAARLLNTAEAMMDSLLEVVR
jgi:flagellar hook-associated protein 1 FlgK